MSDTDATRTRRDGAMTHEDRVWHHEMETLEGIHEHAERIAKLEELVLDMYACATANDDCEPCLSRHDTCIYGGFRDRMDELGVVE